jgi:O-antigen ligase
VRVALVAAIAAAAAVILTSPSNPFGEQRVSYWAVALHDSQAHPILGSGAGTFARYWHAERPLPVDVQDAHSLYLETLAETGPLGLLLIAVALGTPLLVAARNRGTPAVLGLAPAYVAFVVHAGIDWDWEMPVVTLAGLLCGAALLQSPPDETASGAPPGRRVGGRMHFG